MIALATKIKTIARAFELIVAILIGCHYFLTIKRSFLSNHEEYYSADRFLLEIVARQPFPYFFFENNQLLILTQ